MTQVAHKGVFEELLGHTMSALSVSAETVHHRNLGYPKDEEEPHEDLQQLEVRDDPEPKPIHGVLVILKDERVAVTLRGHVGRV